MEGTELPLRRHTCSAASQQTSPESPLPRRRATLAAVAQQLGEVEDVALGAEKLGHGWSRAQVVLLVLLECHKFQDAFKFRKTHRYAELADIVLEIMMFQGISRVAGFRTGCQVRYTLARIVANLCVVPAPVEQLRSQQLGSPGVDERIVRTIDAVARPVVTGLGVYCFLCNKTRFSEKLRLHVWSRRTIFCLACCVADQSVLHVFLQGRSAYKMTVMSCLIWETVCNALQVYMTILKLKALGWGFTARSCEVLLVISFACLAPGCVTVMIFGGSWLTYILMWSSFFTFTLTSLVQSLALCSAATRALLRGGSDEAIRCSAYCLCLNGILAVVGPALSMWSWMSMVRVEFGPLNEDEVFFFAVWVVSIDVGLQVLATLLLSGLIGPKGWDRPMEAFRRLGHLSGFGLASSRIAFPGKINARATQCIVSFPGKYSAQWDNAVANVQQFEDCSLACVFLTDKASGLGRHTDNPDTPGQCWCRMIYGELPAETYLSVVDLKDDSDGVLTKEKPCRVCCFGLDMFEALWGVGNIRRSLQGNKAGSQQRGVARSKNLHTDR